MSRRTIAVLLVLVVGALSATMLASPRVKLILTDGDDMTCRLVDYGGSGFTVQVDGEEENLALGDVAVIDFVGGTISDEEIDLFEAGRHLVVLRNGSYFYGQFADIGGSDPLRLTFKVRGGNRVVSSNEVRRIFLNELD